MREQCRTREATINGAARRRGLHDAVAARTGQLRATMTDDAEVRAHVFELLRDVFAKRFERAAAVRAVVCGSQMNAFFALEMIGQRPADGGLASLPYLLRFGSIGGAFVGLQVLESQFELLDLTLKLLGLAAELHATQLCKHQLQMFNLSLARREPLLQNRNVFVTSEHHCLECIDVVGQCGRGEIHGDSLRVSVPAGSPLDNRLQGTAWAGCVDRLPPVKSFEQERQLSGRQGHGTGIGTWPRETSLLKTLRKEA
jgi:hypothetical protein